MAAVRVEQLVKRYGNVDALRGVGFEVDEGEVFALLGPNGAGKTTTVEILEGFRSRDGGRVEVLGYDPGEPATSRRLRERIGVVLQELAVEPLLTVRQVLSRNAGYYPRPRPVDEVLSLVGLGDKADERVKTLSGGQQRRLDLGLGIVGNPDLLFLDEPTTGFDPSARREAWGVIRALTGGGTTVILTTHYMDEAEALADRLAVVAAGRVVAEGTPESLGGRDVGEARISFRLPAGVARLVAAGGADGRVGGCSRDPHRQGGGGARRPHDLGARGEGRPRRAPGRADDARGRLPASHRAPRARRRSASGPMSTPVARARSRAAADLSMVGRQLYYEQLSFWRNPFAAVFTVGFSVVFLVLLGASAGDARSATLGGVPIIQYYVPGFVAYGVMSTCFNALATSLVVRRETGLLKRLRLSPLPTWAMLAAVIGNALVISLVQIVLLLVIGRFGYHVQPPHNLAALALALLVGAASFTALGIAVSTLIPNQEAAGPIVSIVFFMLLFLSGLWYPLAPHSTLATISSYFPIRHMIEAVYAPFDVRPGVSGWSWHNLVPMLVWGAAGVVVAARHWSWAPRTRAGDRPRAARLPRL